MTSKRKIWTSILIVGIVLTTIIASFGIVGQFWNPFLSSKLVKIYSNNNSYAHFSGTISWFDIDLNKPEENIMAFNEIVNLDKNERMSEEFVDNIEYRIYSSDTRTVWKKLNPKKGLVITFICSDPGNVYFKNPIVQISVGEEEILSFEEGKTALIEWAKTVY